MSFSFERTLEQDERKQALLRAVERLPEQQKEVITLKIWGELTFDEIARILDESLNTVASRYRYALQKAQGLGARRDGGKKGGFFYRLMNEFEKLEAELRELRPLPPSEEFTSRLENALGDAGKVAMRCLPDEDSLEQKKSASTTSEQPSKLLSFPRMAVFTGAAGMGLAALFGQFYYTSPVLWFLKFPLNQIIPNLLF